MTYYADWSKCSLSVTTMISAAERSVFVGMSLEIFLPGNDATAFRIEFFGDEIEAIKEVDVLTGEIKATVEHAESSQQRTLWRMKTKFHGPSQRLKKSLRNDSKNYGTITIIARSTTFGATYQLRYRNALEMGYCNGIENYSRHMDGRRPGQPPYTLLRLLPERFAFVVDESHITMSQIRGMYKGTVLVRSS